MTTTNGRRLRERWGTACWWLADEDLLHFEDGYALHTHVKDGMLSYQLHAIADPTVPKHNEQSWPTSSVRWP